MQRSIYRYLAAVSLVLLYRAGVVHGRPHYGGTLRVEMRSAVGSLNPAEWPSNTLESAAKEKLIALLFETLVQLDDTDRPQPLLALSWQHDPQNKRWRFRLRTDVKFHDGSPMTLEAAAAALRSSGTNWKTGIAGDTLLIESDAPAPDLLFDLARPAHSIFVRGAGQEVYGTGPFQLTKWEPGRHALLAANEQHWAGRPFLDGISVDMGRSLADQRMELEMGKADFVEIWPNELRRLPKEARTWSSLPDELIALVFERGRPAAEDPRIREALALSIDRAAMHSWLMQKVGEPAASLLPQRLSGYAFLFQAAPDLKKARQLLSNPVQQFPRLMLSYDAWDPLARSMAERIAVNVRESGIVLGVSSQPVNPDIRLVRAHINTPLPGPALAGLEAAFRLTESGPLPNNASIMDVQSAESAALSSHRLIPLFHVPEVFASSRRLKTWRTTGIGRFGRWHFEDMWLDLERP
jgi:peptide/nickel transport system substrate-binding protein